MRLFNKIVNLFRSRKPAPPLQTIGRDFPGQDQADSLTCKHGATGHSLTITVLGVKCELKNSPLCAACTERYLDKHSTLCAVCKQPIYPGKPIGYGLGGKNGHAFAHSSCTNAAMFCGHWGEGQPVYAKEPRPDKYGDRSCDVA